MSDLSSSLPVMGDLEQLLEKLDPDPRIRGRQFEHICKWFLTNDPVGQNYPKSASAEGFSHADRYHRRAR